MAAYWERACRESPVSWHPQGKSGFWVVSGYEQATSVYRDSAAFTSERGNVLATLLNGGDSAGGQMLAISDGARHREIRQRLMRAFTPAALASIEARITGEIDRLVGECAARGGGDFVADVAARIPMAAVCDMFGIAESDRAELLQYTSSALSSDRPDATELQAKVARNQILLYFQRLTKQNQARSPDSLLGLLQEMMRPPLRLTQGELLLNCYSLLLGGDETTRLAMTGSVKALMEWPDQWRRLVSGEVGVDSAVDELLRWTSPAMHGGRVATRDRELGGYSIAAGQIVTVWNIAANFDPARFANPAALDLGRAPNLHLTFAFGPHTCLGARLARIELKGLLRALVRHAGRIHPAGPALPVYSNFLHGYSRLPITFTSGGAQ
ncbi:cytochrome P450 [Actinomadura terrae]|uniref:cytochrome P450 n=1 Tax=Actinomadura terrae TaxID=604353 RepID=UPI001FA6ED48|nr:cytochrome P450 [Actinomadura terrae]